MKKSIILKIVIAVALAVFVFAIVNIMAGNQVFNFESFIEGMFLGILISAAIVTIVWFVVIFLKKKRNESLFADKNKSKFYTIGGMLSLFAGAALIYSGITVLIAIGAVFMGVSIPLNITSIKKNKQDAETV